MIIKIFIEIILGVILCYNSFCLGKEVAKCVKDNASFGGIIKYFFVMSVIISLMIANGIINKP